MAKYANKYTMDDFRDEMDRRFGRKTVAHQPSQHSGQVLASYNARRDARWVDHAGRLITVKDIRVTAEFDTVVYVVDGKITHPKTCSTKMFLKLFRKR